MTLGWLGVLAVIVVLGLLVLPRRRRHGGQEGGWTGSGTDGGTVHDGGADCGPGDSGACDGGGGDGGGGGD
jgi:hypothetical protein